MTHRLPIIVFIGPSLGPPGIPDGLEADIRGPAAQGDIVAAVEQYGRCVIALVDGLFQGTPAVRHKEILWALHKGSHVFGAASMGALRAAELSPYGMHGRGLVFRWLRRYPLLPDDAVAVLHAPGEIGGGALTEALVDLRMGIKKALRGGLIDPVTANTLADAAQSLHYTERTLANLMRTVSEKSSRDSKLEAGALRWSQKQRDAALLLNELRDRQEKDDWPVADNIPDFVATDAFLKDLIDSGFSLDSIGIG